MSHATYPHKSIAEQQAERDKLRTWVELLRKSRDEHMAACCGSDYDFNRYSMLISLLKFGAGHQGGVRWTAHPQTTVDLTDWDGFGYDHKEQELAVVEQRLAQLRKQL